MRGTRQKQHCAWRCVVCCKCAACAASVLQMCCKCAANVLQVCCKCAASVLQVCCKRSCCDGMHCKPLPQYSCAVTAKFYTASLCTPERYRGQNVCLIAANINCCVMICVVVLCGAATCDAIHQRIVFASTAQCLRTAHV